MRGPAWGQGNELAQDPSGSLGPSWNEAPKGGCGERVTGRPGGIWALTVVYCRADLWAGPEA